jgi:2-dehydropantoate 2-reductase
MRIIVYGVGAVGGTIAARLAQTGTEVIGIARGAMLQAMQEQGGLTLVSVLGRHEAQFPVVDSPERITFRPDDTILMAMKSQDTEPALLALRAAGVTTQSVVCAQNGVANERAALRYFPNVCGMTVMLPGQYLTPGEVVAFGAPKLALFDLGRYPSGLGADTERLTTALERAGFGCFPQHEVMRSKYGKLLMNLGNIVGAAFGEAQRDGPWQARAKAEGRAVLTAAGIDFEDVGMGDPRRAEMKITEIPGFRREGSSSVQSLMRAAGSIETDYLNGEIVLLGRLHDVPTPVNAALCGVAARMIRERIPAGSFPQQEFAAMVEGRASR